MSTLAEPPLDGASRPLALRMRADLIVSRQQQLGRAHWVIKDPVSLRYFRFVDEEYTILQLLDGRRSLNEIRREFDARFAPHTSGNARVQSFLARLHQAGLVCADAPGQGQELLERRDAARRRRVLSALTNVLAIRFRGVDPERFLTVVYPFAGWFFRRTPVVLCVLLALAALALVTVQFDVFETKLPAFHEFFHVGNAFWLVVALAAVKILHEMGHALACKHFGGECHEIGVMILVLTPCLYCNVSDSWMLSNRWHRIAIAAAGMYVELVLAAVCTFLWWFSEPGLLNHLCLNIMFISSVGTVVFNANPLLRYDGYYILSDLLEIPNLAQKSRAILARQLGRLVLGIEPQQDRLLPERRQFLFALYAVASTIYRWIVLISILWFLQTIFQPYRLAVIGQLMALIAIIGLVFVPLVKVIRYLSIPGRMQQVKGLRFIFSIVLVVAALAAVMLFPLPYRITVPLLIEATGAVPIYVEIGGTLDEILVEPGQYIAEGSPLARLSNLDLDQQVIRLTSQRSQQKVRLEAIKKRLVSSTYGGDELPLASAGLDDLEDRLRQRTEDQRRLLLVATKSGTVLPAVGRPRSHNDSNRLSSWSGTPLEAHNIGCRLEAGTSLCSIGDPTQCEAVLAIDEAVVPFVQTGQEVEIQLDGFPGRTLTARIDEISQRDLRIAPPQLSAKSGGELATKTDDRGAQRPTNATYQARVPLPEFGHTVAIRSRGQARILAGRQSLGQRFLRYLARTFRIDL